MGGAPGVLEADGGECGVFMRGILRGAAGAATRDSPDQASRLAALAFPRSPAPSFPTCTCPSPNRPPTPWPSAARDRRRLRARANASLAVVLVLVVVFSAQGSFDVVRVDGGAAHARRACSAS